MKKLIYFAAFAMLVAVSCSKNEGPVSSNVEEKLVPITFESGITKTDVSVEGNIETQEWLYYEQDGMVVTLGNWLNGRLSCEQIEQLWCELIIPEQNKEQKESEE